MKELTWEEINKTFTAASFVIGDKYDSNLLFNLQQVAIQAMNEITMHQRVGELETKVYNLQNDNRILMDVFKSIRREAELHRDRVRQLDKHLQTILDLCNDTEPPAFDRFSGEQYGYETAMKEVKSILQENMGGIKDAE